MYYDNLNKGPAGALVWGTRSVKLCGRALRWAKLTVKRNESWDEKESCVQVGKGRCAAGGKRERKRVYVEERAQELICVTYADRRIRLLFLSIQINTFQLRNYSRRARYAKGDKKAHACSPRNRSETEWKSGKFNYRTILLASYQAIFLYVIPKFKNPRHSLVKM